MFLGTLRESTIGKLVVKEEKHKLYFKSKFGDVSKKSDDYFSGVIKQNDKPVGEVYGTYLGFVNIDGKRFWDGRKVRPFRFLYDKAPLDSDSTTRKDIHYLEKGKLAEAQFSRDELENTQRKDVKLRAQKGPHQKKK